MYVIDINDFIFGLTIPVRYINSVRSHRNIQPLILLTTWKLSVSVRSKLNPLWDIHSDDWRANCAAFYIIPRTWPVLLCNEARVFYHSLSLMLYLSNAGSARGALLFRETGRMTLEQKERGVRGCHSLGLPASSRTTAREQNILMHNACTDGINWNKLPHSAAPEVQSNPRLHLYRERSPFIWHKILFKSLGL